ncbi:MAG TPA: cyclic pyranopterin monophosphate synthase MoaC [Bacteroidales bacterium]|nr:cyclic pyranopterin monophosphate synthase MoaC [Bacteroidales bacterium]HSA44128.1 cyclic pyranopterin monophosphate synthase MoaC [Bacteroidales bacterium]
MNELSHTNPQGKARMVDVGNKIPENRSAIASGFIRLKAETLTLIAENLNKKGDVLAIAEIAGIQAAKQTSGLIPLCHPLLLSKISVTCNVGQKGITVVAEVRCTGQTGVEMEALTAVSIALLTIYDMCKAVDKEMVIENIRLLEKTKEPIH